MVCFCVLGIGLVCFLRVCACGGVVVLQLRWGLFRLVWGVGLDLVLYFGVVIDVIACCRWVWVVGWI